MKSVEDDFTNGVPLIEMVCARACSLTHAHIHTHIHTHTHTHTHPLQLQQVSGKKIGKYTKEPKMKAHKLENLTHAFEFMKKEGKCCVCV